MTWKRTTSFLGRAISHSLRNSTSSDVIGMVSVNAGGMYIMSIYTFCEGMSKSSGNLENMVIKHIELGGCCENEWLQSEFEIDGLYKLNIRAKRSKNADSGDWDSARQCSKIFMIYRGLIQSHRSRLQQIKLYRYRDVGDFEGSSGGLRTLGRRPRRSAGTDGVVVLRGSRT